MKEQTLKTQGNKRLLRVTGSDVPEPEYYIDQYDGEQWVEIEGPYYSEAEAQLAFSEWLSNEEVESG